jgi:hypothetical protein
MAADDREATGSEEAPNPPAHRPDVAAATGRMAGRMATGLGGALLRNRTVRKTIRRAQEEARGEEPPAAG